MKHSVEKTRPSPPQGSSSGQRQALLIAGTILLAIIAAELVVLLLLNEGHLVYTLDDPYIHLALAENLQQGHYGINSGESSAPASSILWPVLLTPLVSLPHAEYAPLLINIVVSLLTLGLFWRILVASLPMRDDRRNRTVIAILLVALAFATNLVGLVFVGMEHSLQVLSVAAIVWGLIVEMKEGRVIPLLLIAIVMAPLVRYESTGMALAALLFLLLRRHSGTALVLTGIVALLLVGFSLFLLYLGLDPLPSSVEMKSPVAAGVGAHLMENLRDRKGLLLAYGLLGFLYYALFSGAADGKRSLASVIALAILLHLLGGTFSGYNRYEIYLWCAMLLAVLHCGGPVLGKWLDAPERNLSRIALLAGLPLILTCSAYFYALVTLPLASNNIYEQHYQMHRFAVEYYGKPVGVNDIGYVSFRNDSYVLDLWGLTSQRTLALREGSSSPEWLNDLAREHDVHFAMIYDAWFPQLPQNWMKIGELHLGKRGITPAGAAVAFYALDTTTYAALLPRIHAFQQNLPVGTRFILRNSR